MQAIDEVDARDAGALFSPCRRWRYLLFRRWDASKGACMFTCLNPSTADETKDDPTVRRCIRFARDWGYGSLWMTNLFAFRATDPLEMKLVGQSALGPRNNEYLLHCARQAELVVGAWGAHGRWLGRDDEVTIMLTRAGVNIHALAETKDGAPRHPLYLPSKSTPKLWAANYQGAPVLTDDSLPDNVIALRHGVQGR